MFFIDTHTHLNDPDLYEERDAVMGRAREEGVGLLLVASYDLLSAKRALLLAEEYPECRPAIGLHPENLEESSSGDWEDIQALASRNEVLAIGETGLDYHWVKDEGLRARQRKLFIEHIELADALGLPLTIHSRDAAEDTLKILQEHTPKHGAVMHCYGYSAQMVPAFARLGMYFGFGGVLTFKNARVAKEALLACPKERILFETDAPYLSPEPYRGKRNEPAYVKWVYRKASELLSLPMEEVEGIARENAERIFHVKHQ